MAAKAERPFRSSAGPYRPQVDADGREDGDMENCQDAFGEIFRLLELKSDTAKPEIEDASAAGALVADDGVGIGSDHGNTFGFALNRERSLGNGPGNLLGQSSGCG